MSNLSIMLAFVIVTFGVAVPSVICGNLAKRSGHDAALWYILGAVLSWLAVLFAANWKEDQKEES